MRHFIFKSNKYFLGSHSQHLGGDLQRRYRCSLLVEAHPEEAVHRHRQEVAHPSRIQGSDGGRRHHLRQTVQGRHLHQHPGLEQRRLLTRQDRHR